MQGDIAKQIARWTALTALFLVPLAPLIVSNSLFFPFITGKAFYFRILIEIAVCAWAVLAMLDKEYRPRFSYIGAAVLAFVLWMFVADIFAINVAKAFWSNFERMEGWVLLIHLLGFFVAASAVLRVEKKWRAWFLTSLAVSAIVVCHAFFQIFGWAAIHQGANRIDASFGNSAYLAIYFLFSASIAGWLALTEKENWLKWSLIILGLIEAVLIFYTETRGTIIGLAGGIAVAALLAALTWSGKARRMALGTLVALVILVGGFLLIKDTSFVRNNDVLDRLAGISSAHAFIASLQVRFTLWHMAEEGVMARPVTGYGQEGFNYVFEKYYDPSLYAQEPWFDRAHNAFIDWLVAGGIPAFLLYLALFGTALVALWRSSTLSRPERIALTAALVGYAFHNLVVFDNLYSYVYFFAILALIDSQVARPIAYFERLPELGDDVASIYALPLAGIAALLLIGFVNYPGMRAGTELITALSPQQAGVSANLATFEDLLTHPAFAGQEIREQLVSFASSLANSSATDEIKQQAATLAVSQMSEQNTEHPGDARTLLELAIAYRTLQDNANSLKAIQAAEAVSPTKEQIYIQEGASRWDGGDTTGAAAAFAKAYALGQQFPDLAAYAAAGKIITGDRAGAQMIIKQAYGTTTVDNDVLALAYFRTKDYPDLIKLWQLRASAPGAGAEQAYGLAAAYYVAGDIASAIAQTKATAAKYPDTAAESTQILNEIEGKPAQ